MDQSPMDERDGDNKGINIFVMDERDGDNKGINIFCWRDKDRDIKINLLLEQFWSTLHFQNMRYKGNKSLKKIFIIFHF